MKTQFLMLVAVVGSNCVPQVSDSPDPVYSVRIVQTYDADGVGTATCPSNSRVVGGGCGCKQVGAPLFGAAPAGNAFVCGCYSTSSTGERGVDVFASCLSSDTPGTLSQGLQAPPTRDPETARVEEEFRAQQRAR